MLDSQFIDQLPLEIGNFMVVSGIMLATVIWIDNKINYNRLKNAVSNKTVIMFVMTGTLIFLTSNIGFLLTKTPNIWVIPIRSFLFGPW